jgi:predicted RNase H-like nuclease (RuvC/YqgF family)
MNSKRFNAAEKHFEKKRIQLEKRIKSLEQQLESAHRDTRIFRSRMEFLEIENEELKDWVERLLQYTELSKEDIKAACEKDKCMGEAVSWLTRFAGLCMDIPGNPLFNNRRNQNQEDT